MEGENKVKRKCEMKLRLKENSDKWRITGERIRRGEIERKEKELANGI